MERQYERTTHYTLTRDLWAKSFGSGHGGYSGMARVYRKAAEGLAVSLCADERRWAKEQGALQALRTVNENRAKYYGLEPLGELVKA